MAGWTLTDLKDLATIIGVIVAVGTFIKAVFEYSRQGAQKRAEAYFALERSFWDEADNRNICELLESGSAALAKVPLAAKLGFVGFIEELALMVNSRHVREEVAHYMFGYFAILCYDSVYFWEGENKDHKYWTLFRAFAMRMKDLEKGPGFDAKRLRF